MSPERSVTCLSGRTAHLERLFRSRLRYDVFVPSIDGYIVA
jgi:hypothetical protein